MNIKAIWIIDKNYIVPAYLSISSFLQANPIPILVVFCGNEGIQEAKLLFTGMHEGIAFETFDTPIEFENNPEKIAITNRLARMHYAKKSENEVILLLDADALFTEHSTELLTLIEADREENEAAIYGVLDAPISFRDYNYFRTQDSYGRDITVSHQEQRDIYTKVFGQNWWHHLKGASINNGVVAFFNCKEVIDTWKTFYLNGITIGKVNPGDDQLPLAAAIHKTSQKVVTLADRFNSKGKVSGEYVVYHALSSLWKMQILSAYRNESGVSDYADLAKGLLPTMPQNLLLDFLTKENKIQPYLFRKLEGKFGFQHLYEDIISGLDSGNVIEVGMKGGKSTCFMIELIRNSRKDIRFDALRMDQEKNIKLDPFFEIIDSFKLKKYVRIYDSSNYQIQADLKEKIDFVFLNLENDYTILSENLELWFSNLKPGGILAGYDYTSQSGLNFGNHCATYNFCNQRNISLRISFNIFIIEKPYEVDEEIKTVKKSLVLKNSNVKR